MEIRTLRESERASLTELLAGHVLPDGRPAADPFQSEGEREADVDVLVTLDGSEVIATLNVRWLRLRVLGHAVPTGGLGGLFVREDRRRRGVGKALLEHAVAAMRARGFELSLLFSDRPALFERLGFSSWTSSQALLGMGSGQISGRQGSRRPPKDLLLRPFERDCDLPVVQAIHSAYSAQRSGTHVRDDAAWGSSLGVGRAVGEEFRVACAGEKVVAYARAALLPDVFAITELGRLEGGEDALAELIADLLAHQAPGAPGGGAADRRAFALLPVLDDIPLTLALEHRGVSVHPIEDGSAMLCCLDAPALAVRLDVSLLPGEGGGDFLRRILPPDGLACWPSDRF